MKRLIIIRLLIALLLPLMTSNVCAGVNKAFAIYNNKKMKGSVKLEKITYEFIDSKYYFAASIFAKKRLERRQKINKRFEEALQTLVLKTGVDNFTQLSEKVLRNHDSKTLAFVLGLKYYKQNRLQEAYNMLIELPQTHKFTPEARFTQGVILNINNKDERAILKYRKCIEVATKTSNSFKHEKIKRYYTIIKENCQIHLARMQYRKGNFKEAIQSYNAISKNSYLWPYILVEKAWASYQLKDYNRTLGLLVTYRSPLLSSYFFPEAEALASLSYYRLCLWNDSSIVIKQYYEQYRPKSSKLKKLLMKHKQSDSYFFKLAKGSINDADNEQEFLRNLIVQIKKKIKYSMDVIPLNRAEKELKYLKRHKRTIFTDYIVKRTKETVRRKERELNHFIKVSMFDFINQMHRYSAELFKIKLEIMSKSRTLIYENKSLVSNRSRGDLDHVNRTINEHFWNFNGAFWADELGEYSFGLKSNCATKTTKQKVEK